MSKGVNIFSDEWCTMVFESKNQEYGAYIIRKEANKRHVFALIIGVLIFGLAVSSPMIISKIIPEEEERMTEVTQLIDIKPLDTKKEEVPKEEIIIEQPKIQQIQYVAPVITTKEVKVEEELKSVEELKEDKGVISNINQEGIIDSVPDLGDLKEQEVVVVEEKPYDFVAEMPQFPGGQEALSKYLAESIVYPDMARENQISGTVQVQFVVDKDGSIKDIIVVKKIHPSLDKEAMRAVASMPKWSPGRQNGINVKVKKTVPVRFVLKD